MNPLYKKSNLYVENQAMFTIVREEHRNLTNDLVFLLCVSSTGL